MDDQATLRSVTRLLHAITFPEPHAAYDVRLTVGGRFVYVVRRRTNGRVGVTVPATTHRALAALAADGALAAYLVNGDILVPLSRLIGVAHVHIHHFDGALRSVVFRVLNGRPAAPRYCFTKCDGPLS